MINFSSNLAILFPLGCCLYIAMRLSDGQVDGKGGGWARALVYTVTTLLISFSFAGVLFRAGLISLVWMFVSACLCLLIWIKSQAVNRSLLLHSFASVDSNAAREQMAVDFVQRNGWLVASKAKRLRRALQAGLDWPKAMQEVGIAKTTAEIFSCRCMAEFGPNMGGSLSPSLDPLRIQSETERLLARLMLLPWSMLGFVIIPLMMWRIIPMFKAMFDEFGLVLPKSMLSFIALCDFLVQTPLDEMIFFLVFLIVVAFGCVGIVWFFPRLALMYPFRWFVRPYFRALGLTSLALSIRRESDFTKACEAAANRLPVWFIANEIRAAGGFHSQGMPPDKAIVKAGILKSGEAELLNASIKSHSFSWAIEQVAVTTMERMLQLYSVAIQLLIVITVLFFAVLFGWLAIGVIEVLTLMIQQMS
jgi:type II secretory pathway component PulF